MERVNKLTAKKAFLGKHTDKKYSEENTVLPL